jgi:hypothetical protein
MEKKTYKSLDICAACFEENERDIWTCLLCSKNGNEKKIKQEKGRGYSNLIKHALSHGVECDTMVESFLASGTVGLKRFFGSITDEARNIYSWLDFIIMNDLSLRCVDNPNILRHVKMDQISRKTLDKYLYKTIDFVKDIIKTNLPQRFGIIYDGWSCDGEHYIAIFATYSSPKGNVVHRLLSCGVQDLPATNEDVESFGFAAEDIGDYLFDVLANYNRTYDALQFICADNAAVNGRLSYLLSQYLTASSNVTRNVPLVGCASHRLNLAVKSVYEEGTANGHLVAMVDDLMKSLNTLKNRPKLFTETTLCPEIRNLTRWGSTYSMLKKYVNLRRSLCNIAFDSELKKKINQVAIHDAAIDTLVLQLKNFEDVSMFLQSDSPDVNLYRVRQLFDGLILEDNRLRPHLSPTADIVYDRTFESGIVKLQRGDPQLSRDEANALHIFKIQHDAQDHEDSEMGFVERILHTQDDAHKRRKVVSQYESTAHVCPTSNACERLFSRAKLVMRPHRRHMDPSTLEAILMLRMNKDMWDEVTIQKIITKDRQEKAAKRLRRDNVSDDEIAEKNCL